MSADKYPCIFLRQMEAIVYIYLCLTLYGKRVRQVPLSFKILLREAKVPSEKHLCPGLNTGIVQQVLHI